MEKQVVVIYPHPDDESFSVAGSVVEFREQGIPVTYLCGTLGEMGRNMGNPNIANRETLPQIRKRELINACNILDMELEMLGYRDKTIEFEDRTEVAKHLKTYLDELKPTLVITFHPELAVHPDHNALGAAAVEAVRMMDEAVRPTVWVQAISNDYEEKLGEPDVIRDISPYFDKKLEAIFSHVSQANGVLSNFHDRDDADNEIRNMMEKRFKEERFYIWDFEKE